MDSISVVINTKNEEKNILSCIQSIKEWADEILVVDMESHDQTVDLAKKNGAVVYNHPNTDYVEPARNKAIELAKGPWILILDADEQISEDLKKYLESIIQSNKIDFVKLPRANYILGGVLEYGGWWPDYNVRFFRKGFVVWQNQIHSQPITKGAGINAPIDIRYAIKHNHYQSVSQFISRLDRYTTIQANELSKNHQFKWEDLISYPINEFYRRYFDMEGWKDGTRGLALAVLQSFSELVLYLKIWELQKFINEEININEIDNRINQESKNWHSWLATVYGKKRNFYKKIIHAIKRRL